MDNTDTTIVETHSLIKRHSSGLIRPTSGAATVAVSRSYKDHVAVTQWVSDRSAEDERW